MFTNVPDGPDRVPNLRPDQFGERGLSWPRALAYLLLGLLLANLAYLASRYGYLLGGYGVPHLVAWAAGALTGLALAFASARVLLRARRYRAPSARQVLARDPRPPVLYFRPFADDATAARSVDFQSFFTEEEQLARVMKLIGPFIGIGAPGEALPELGAARFYTGDTDWQNAVLHLLSQARLVVLRVGRSPGFWWELETSLHGRAPEQLVLLVPRDETLYEEFRLRSRALMPCDLPRLTGWNYHKWRRGSLMAAIFFDADWVPNIVQIQTYSLAFYQRSPALPLVPVLRMALRPVFEHLGVAWKPPRVNPRLILGLSGLLLAAAIQLSWYWDSDSTVTGGPVRIAQAPPAPTALEQAQDRLSERLLAIPAVHNHLEAIGNRPELKNMPAEEASRRVRALAAEYTSEHTRAGLRRLDDAGLLSKLELDRKILTLAEPADCAAFARGKVSPEQMTTLLGKLDRPDIERWFDVLLQAISADAAGVPPARSPDASRVSRSYQSILRALPPVDSAELRRITADFDGASDEQVCWCERTLREAISHLIEKDRVAWALSMVQ